MNKIINLIMILLVFFFFFNVFKFYSSNSNIKKTKLNRVNIDEILKNRTGKIPFLVNDTDNVIVFNDSFNEEIKKDKPRKFWDLLKKDE